MRGGASKASKVPHLHFMVSGRDDMVAVDDFLLCLLGDMAWRVGGECGVYVQFSCFSDPKLTENVRTRSILRCKGIGTKIRKEG
jgi:hypothetical protein